MRANIARTKLALVCIAKETPTVSVPQITAAGNFAQAQRPFGPLPWTQIPIFDLPGCTQCGMPTAAALELIAHGGFVIRREQLGSAGCPKKEKCGKIGPGDLRLRHRKRPAEPGRAEAEATGGGGYRRGQQRSGGAAGGDHGQGVTGGNGQ